MNDKTITLRRILMMMLFFIIGATLQGIMIRRVSFICYFALLATVLFVMISDRQFYFGKISNVVDIRDILLIVAMVSYRIATYTYYSESHDLTGNFIWATAPVMLYLFGKYYIFYNYKNSYKASVRVIIPLGMGLMLFNFISIISYYVYGGTGEEGRDWHMMLMDADSLRATFYAFYPLLYISLVIWAIYTFKKNRVISLIVIITGIFSVSWFWLVVQTRSPFFVFFISIAIMGILYLLSLIKKDGFKKYKETIIIVLSLILIIINVVLLAYNTNILGFKDWYMASTFTRDRPLLDNPRLHMAWSAICNLPNYPFGNNHTEIYEGYITTHVYWTEFAYCGGFIPFLAIIGWLVMIIKDVIFIGNNKDILLEEKSLLLLSLFAMFFYACTEALRDMFEPFLVMLFAGMIRGKVLSKKERETL